MEGRTVRLSLSVPRAAGTESGRGMSRGGRGGGFGGGRGGGFGDRGSFGGARGADKGGKGGYSHHAPETNKIANSGAIVAFQGKRITF